MKNVLKLTVSTTLIGALFGCGTHTDTTRITETTVNIPAPTVNKSGVPPIEDKMGVDYLIQDSDLNVAKTRSGLAYFAVKGSRLMTRKDLAQYKRIVFKSKALSEMKFNQKDIYLHHRKLDGMPLLPFYEAEAPSPIELSSDGSLSINLDFNDSVDHMLAFERDDDPTLEKAPDPDHLVIRIILSDTTETDNPVKTVILVPLNNV